MASNTTKVVAIAVVAIIVIAGVGMFLMKDESEETHIESFLPVYGNANDDFKISSEDVDIIQQVIDGKHTLAEYPLADANHDGNVDQKDIDQVNGMINKTADCVWHINEIGDTQTVEKTKWPVEAAMATATPNVAVFLKMLDITDKFKAISYGSSSKPDPILFPEFQDMASIGKSTSIEYENASKYVTEYGCTAIVTSTNQSYMKNYEDMENHNIDIIRIDATGTSIQDFLGSVLLLAFLFDANDKSEEICVFTEKLLDDVEKRLEKIGSKVIAVASNTNGTIASPTSDYNELLEVAGATLPTDPRYTSSLKIASADWIYDIQIDKLVNIRTGGGLGGSWYTGNFTDENVKKIFDPFYLMDAYKSNEIYIINGELPVPLRLVYACEVLYPDIFEDGYADKYHQDWCDKIYEDGLIDISKLDTIFNVADYK